MKKYLETKWKIKDICEGFIFKEDDWKGVHGLNSKLVIQPEYQRNYIYGRNNEMDKAVIYSLMKKHPIGLLYFVRPEHGKEHFEVLDGQQRITSICRFRETQFAIKIDGWERNYDKDNFKDFDETSLLVYVCESDKENEIKEWFKTINIVGLPLNEQEILNAIYSGPFVSASRKHFGKSAIDGTSKIWSSYLSCNANRQECLAKALAWLTKSKDTTIDSYLNINRENANISELTDYFDSVIGWASNVFKYDKISEIKKAPKDLATLDWGRLYEQYKNEKYDSDYISKKLKKLYADDFVSNHKGAFEFLLTHEKEVKLLQIRMFNSTIKNKKYNEQTEKAVKNGHSNCRLCKQIDKVKTIYKLDEMEADHVEPWSKGGDSTIENCEMLCKKHNRMKGND
ncbi:HNH endonuclease family protein [Mycoplasmopsis agassizii]|uniref:HNH nuclease domain-containing protein n=1 Tax=Mycoplasmopsis agassizii TaxID=33922 RepID=A0ABX4H4G0_9BACT|nr:DUF262 domain-containing protein [Mycoplasmopsis agassizii]PAF54770.1 hypothetical protein CJF60_03470 [Mycoplasmopsis agassizii]SMC19707.1 HNH endonuclease [Mycoplasmopsis agassizii]